MSEGPNSRPEKGIERDEGLQDEIDIITEELQNTLDELTYGYNIEIENGNLLVWVYPQNGAIVEPGDLNRVSVGIKNLLALNEGLSNMDITKVVNPYGGIEIHLTRKLN